MRVLDYATVFISSLILAIHRELELKLHSAHTKLFGMITVAMLILDIFEFFDQNIAQKNHFSIKNTAEVCEMF